MSEFTNEERVILNVGGVKYETLSSTLISQPRTLLGVMFSERNRMLLQPLKGNEYFFDRNGRAFHYILEYYRTGKILWSDRLTLPSHAVTVSREELEAEMDFFMIPASALSRPSSPCDDPEVNPVHKAMSEMVDGFVAALEMAANEMTRHFRRNLSICLYSVFRTDNSRVPYIPGSSRIVVEPYVESIVKLLHPYDAAGFVIVQKLGTKIAARLQNKLPGVEFTVKYFKPDNYCCIGIRYVEKIDYDAILRLSCLDN